MAQPVFYSRAPACNSLRAADWSYCTRPARSFRLWWVRSCHRQEKNLFCDQIVLKLSKSLQSCSGNSFCFRSWVGRWALYSCQLDAVVGDVREATRRKAGGWGGRWGGHARSALPVIGSVDRAGFDIVRFPKSMWGGKPDMVWDKSLDIIIT